jgi:hypothetical protein
MNNNNEIIENVNDVEEVYEEEMENETGRGITLGKVLFGLILGGLSIFGVTKLVKFIKNKRNKNNVEVIENNDVKNDKKNNK